MDEQGRMGPAGGPWAQDPGQGAQMEDSRPSTSHISLTHTRAQSPGARAPD